MPKVSKKSSKKSRKDRRSKISQKVIQNVIVRVGEERKAKKARRKQRRINRRDLEAIQEQQINSKVAPMVVYQTAAPFQQPQPIYNFAQEASSIKSKENPRYLEIEPQPLEFIENKSKKQQLSEFIDPVAEAMDKGENIKSSIYSREMFPQTKVAGNYAFGEFDEGSSDTASINSVAGITQPQSRVMTLGEWVSQNGRDEPLST